MRQGLRPLPDGGYGIVFQTASNNNCCDGKDACHLDSAGIPRCFGGCSNSGCTGPTDCPFGYTGQPGCCIPAYDGGCQPTGPCPSQCQFGDQCCDGNPCLPLDPGNPSSIYVCTPPACRALGSTCTVGGTPCCEGSCLPSETGDLCQLSLPPPDGGPTCKANGANCIGNAECCSLLCIDGLCQAPQSCQPQGGVCTATADCCTGLTCSIPAGQASGTCETGSTCPSAGQQCSPTQACCPGLLCTDQGTFTSCSGTTVCICVNPG